MLRGKLPGLKPSASSLPWISGLVRELLPTLNLRVIAIASKVTELSALQSTQSQISRDRARLKHALDLLNNSHYRLNPAAYASLLQLCGNLKALCDGKRIHHHLSKINYGEDHYIGSFLVQMYVKCGVFDVAQELFVSMKERSVYLCNFMIGTYSRHGLGHEALRFFEQMVLEGMTPDRVTCVNVISLCSCHGTLAQAKKLHVCIFYMGLHTDLVVSTALISLYGKLSSIEDARHVFDDMAERNVISWNAMIGACSQHVHGVEVFQLFEQILQEGLLPDRVTFISMISACAGTISLTEGKMMHARIAHSKLELDVVVATALINMYGKCGSLGNGQCVFDILPGRNLFSWNAMIAAYAQHGSRMEALELFHLMKREGVVPDKVTLVSILLVYAKCRQLEDAQRIFQEMPDRNAICWNAMITAFVQHGQDKKAIEHFYQMQFAKVAPDKVTFCNILSACANQVKIEEGKQMHSHIVYCGYELDLYVGNALINMYGKCDSVEEAWNIFQAMPLHDVVSWNAMIAANSHCGKLKEALQMFDQMQSEAVMLDMVTFIGILEAIQGALAEGKRIHAIITHSGFALDDAMVTALVDMYGKCGSLEAARRLFDDLPEKSVVSWNAVISVYAQHGQGERALQLFDEILQVGATPNKITYISILSVCASLAALTKGKHIYTHILHSKVGLDVVIETALVNLYNKCGRLMDARKAFDEMPEQDVVAWNAMIAAYAQHGNGKEAVELFYQMLQEGLVPDAVTFVNCLSACSHTGLLDDGRHIFNLMKQGYGINPAVEHYDCMIDLLGRAGCLEEVDDLIKKMPFGPSMISWMTLLGACRNEVDVERGEQAAHCMFEMDSMYDSPYVVLSNIYTAAGREEDAEKMVNIMRAKGMLKRPPYSSIQVSRMADEMLVDNELHPQGTVIHIQLEELADQLKESKYVSDSKIVFNSMEKNKPTFPVYRAINFLDRKPVLITRVCVCVCFLGGRRGGMGM